jgi:hypothetical protein
MKLIQTIALKNTVSEIASWEAQCKEIDSQNGKIKAAVKKVSGFSVQEKFSWGVREGELGSSQVVSNVFQFGLNSDSFPPEESFWVKSKNGTEYFVERVQVAESPKLLEYPQKPEEIKFNRHFSEKAIRGFNPDVTYESLTAMRDRDGYKEFTWWFPGKIAAIDKPQKGDYGGWHITKRIFAHEYRVYPDRLEVWEKVVFSHSYRASSDGRMLDSSVGDNVSTSRDSDGMWGK